MSPLPPRARYDIVFELDGWGLFVAELERVAGGGAALAAVREAVARRARERFDLDSLTADPTVTGLRELFKAAGCSPSRYRPSSEALLRRLVKGEELPAINPLVDCNNALSAELAVPCCVMAEGTFEPPFVLRSGRPGEAYESLKGPFRLAGKPLLADRLGPCDAPITGSRRVMVGEETRRAWLVAYLPAGVVTPERAAARFAELLERAPVARWLRWGSAPAPPL